MNQRQTTIWVWDIATHKKYKKTYNHSGNWREWDEGREQDGEDRGRETDERRENAKKKEVAWISNNLQWGTWISLHIKQCNLRQSAKVIHFSPSTSIFAHKEAFYFANRTAQHTSERILCFYLANCGQMCGLLCLFCLPDNIIVVYSRNS